MPIVDAGATGDTVSGFAQVTAIVQKLSALSSTMSSVLNTQHDVSAALGFIGAGINDTGGGSLGELIADAQMGFQAFQQAKNTYQVISSQVKNLANDPFGGFSVLSILNILASDAGLKLNAGALNKGVNLTQLQQLFGGQLSVQNAATTIQTSLFTGLSQATTSQTEAINGARRAVAQNASIQGVTAAATSTQTNQVPGDAMLALGNGVANASDQRGDIKANNAILLKILEQASAENALLAKLVYVHSTGVIGTQDTYGPLAGTALQ